MDVRRSTRLNAAFRILRDVIRDEPVVDADEFWHLWRQTGLRGADCQRAIDDLVTRGYLRSTLKASRRTFTLTAVGLREITHPRTPLARRLKDWFTLRGAQARCGRHGNGDYRGRRPAVDAKPDAS